MKLSILLCVCVLARGVFPHMPTVYEFCSHVVANGEGGRATCDASQCQGRPGKIGPVGSRGIQGLRGQKGERSAKIGPVGPRGIQGLKGQKGEQSAKIGPAGPRGIQGLRGQKGETGTSEAVEEKVRILEESLKQIDAMMTYQPMKETVCYMGMKSGQIPDSAVTSSSDFSADHAAHLGRLDNQPSGSKWGTWVAGRSVVGDWIQVDLGQSKVVAGVVTQGRPVHGQWVNSYKVSCGNVQNSMTSITEHGRDKVFSANTDKDTKVVNKFPQIITCRYIRIYPQSFHVHMSMRFEIIRGICKDYY